MADPSLEKELPVTVIGGYLGAGKTTLVNQILRQANKTRLAVLVNDFGDISIDADLIESADDQVLNLAGGCVCCSIGSDLVSTLGELRERLGEFDHVLLETSGVAMPGVVAATVSLAPAVRRHAVLVVVDLLNGPGWLADAYIGDTIERQIAAADILLLNKQALADSQKSEKLIQRLGDLAPTAPQLLINEQLPVASLLDFGQVDKRSPGAFLSPTHTDLYLNCHFVSKAAVDVGALKAYIESGQFELLRAKGFLRDMDGKNWLIQAVGARCVLRAWAPLPQAIGQLTVIAQRNSAPNDLINSFATLGLQLQQATEQQTQ